MFRRNQGGVGGWRAGAALAGAGAVAGGLWAAWPGSSGAPEVDDPAQPEDRVDWVVVGALEVSRSEVTLAQYRRCVAAGDCTRPDMASRRCHWLAADREDHPVNCVDRGQARAFARWAGGRLPTEAEWERVARSEIPWRKHAWGDAAPRECLQLPCEPETVGPVCDLPDGDTPLGVCDMAGNVWEWVEDARPRDRPFRVLKGGGAEIAERQVVSGGLRWPQFGIRVVRRAQ